MTNPDRNPVDFDPEFTLIEFITQMMTGLLNGDFHF